MQFSCLCAFEMTRQWVLLLVGVSNCVPCHSLNVFESVCCADHLPLDI